jgi:hypothetical protein
MINLDFQLCITLRFHMSSLLQLGLADSGLGYVERFLVSGDVRSTAAANVPDVSSASPTMSFLYTIPPERIGLDGEYDHAGLSKRVQVAVHQQLGEAIVAGLKISQRGCVVICTGKSLTHQLARQLRELILQVEGCAFVEIYDSDGLLYDAA